MARGDCFSDSIILTTKPRKKKLYSTLFIQFLVRQPGTIAISISCSATVKCRASLSRRQWKEGESEEEEKGGNLLYKGASHQRGHPKKIQALRFTPLTRAIFRIPPARSLLRVSSACFHPIHSNFVCVSPVFSHVSIQMYRPTRSTHARPRLFFVRVLFTFHENTVAVVSDDLYDSFFCVSEGNFFRRAH